MPLDSLYICYRCSRKFPIGNIRYDRNGKLVCMECLGTSESYRARYASQQPEPNILNFICIDCRYKFRIKKGVQQKILCPYCGRNRVMQIKKLKDEDDLIRDASNSKFDY